MLFGIGGTREVPEGLRVSPEKVPAPERDIDPADATAASVAVLAGGCFWCVEGIYRMLDGVLEAVSGYVGGTPETANYRDVCSGRTGHAEAVRLKFDPARISYGQILRIFFAVAHDPTQHDRQGNDVGPQYRSAIFPADAAQREVAEAYIRQLDAAGVFVAPIATRIEPLEAFHEAEDYHQDYAALNPTQPYIACVAQPKMGKLRKHFPDLLKSGG